MSRIADPRRTYGVVKGDQREKIGFTLWHRLTYTSGATLSLEFFTVAASGLNGNLPGAGQLPNGNQFLVKAIRIMPALRPQEAAGAAIAAGTIAGPIEDMFQFITTGHAAFSVGDKNYGRWPIFMLPAGAGLTGQVHVSGISAAAGNLVEHSWANNGNADPRQVYTLDVPILIPSQYNFKVVLEWPVAVAASASFTNPFIFVMLDGQLVRPSQ